MDASQRDQLFGRWLHRRRRALDLTQKELARLVGCSVHTIRKLESGGRRPSKPIAGAIARVTGVPDDEHDAFVRYARAGGPSDAHGTARGDMRSPWRLDPTSIVERQAGDAHAAQGGDIEFGLPRFLARATELDRLHEALCATVQGRGQVLLISGEAGQGKTSLMEVFAARAQAERPDLLTVLGSCNAYTGNRDPFAPFREILAQLTGHTPSDADRTPAHNERHARLRAFLPHALRGLLDHGPDLLGTLLPVRPLRARLSEFGITTEEPESGGSGGALTGRLGGQSAVILRSETVDVLTHIAAHMPLLVLLDNLQWADENSLALLAQLARAVPHHRILIAAAYRTGEVPPSDESASVLLPHAVHDLERQFDDVHIDLDDADGRAFLDAWIDSEPNALDETFRAALHQQTGGQPLLTIELLRAMHLRGDLVRGPDGRWIAGPDLRWDALPVRIAGALEERIARLGPRSQDVLTAASIEGCSFTVEVVAQVLGLEPVDVAHVVSHDLDREYHLVEPAAITRLGNGQRASRYRFRHDLIQRYVLDQVGESERSYLHEKVATATVALFGDAADPLTLAYHYTRAHAPALAAPYYREAGARALRTGALSDAHRALQTALGAWPETDHVGRADLLNGIAVCLLWSGDKPQAERVLQSSVDEYDALGDRTSEGALRSSMNLIATTVPPGGPTRNAYLAWLPALEASPELLPLAFAATRLAYAFLHEDDERALAFAERAVTIAEDLRNDQRRAQGLNALGLVLAQTSAERRDNALAILDESIATARRLRAPVEEAVGLQNLAIALEGFGRVEAASEHLRELLDLCRRLELRGMERQGRAQLFRLDWLQGRWSGAQAVLPQLRAEADRYHLRASVLAMAELDLSRPAQAQPWLEEIRATLEPGIWLPFHATSLRELLRAAATSGDTSAAHRCANWTLDVLDDRTSYPHGVIEVLVSVACWLARYHDDEGRQHVERCVRILERTERQYGSVHAKAGLAAARGALAQAEGAAAAAAEHYLRAAEFWSEQGYVLFEARAHWAAGGMLSRVGADREGAGERARAGELLERLALQLEEKDAASFMAIRERRDGAPEAVLL